MQQLNPAPKLLDDETIVNPRIYPASIDLRLRSQFRTFDSDSDSVFLIPAAFLSTPDEISQSNLSRGIRAFADYAGPQTPNLDGLNANAVAKFVEADKAYFNATGRYLQIESGRRTVFRQAELYVCWRLGESGCNPADIPGASVHNYGFAIDIRSAGEASVVTALSGNGWERTVLPREPWHWEATSANGYSDAKQKQAEMKAGGSISRRWQDQWEAARTKNDTRNRKIEEFNSRVQAWQPEWDRLRVDVETLQNDSNAYNQRAEHWDRDRVVVSDRIDRFNGEITELQQLRARIENMPDGPDKNDLIIEYNRRNQALLEERDRIESAQADLIARKQSLDSAYGSLQQRNQDLQNRYSRLDAEKSALLRLREEIDKLEAQIRDHLQNDSGILQQIATIVEPL